MRKKHTHTDTNLQAQLSCTLNKQKHHPTSLALKARRVDLPNGRADSTAEEELPQRGARGSQKLRPVLVIIHGDSFDFGSGHTLNPRPFVLQSGQLLVTMNYRLNILGKLGALSRILSSPFHSHFHFHFGLGFPVGVTLHRLLLRPEVQPPTGQNH